MSLALTLVGSVGLLMICIAFFLENSGRLNREDFTYDLLNFLGAGILIVYAAFTNATIFLILNSFWALVALKDLVIK